MTGAIKWLRAVACVLLILLTVVSGGCRFMRVERGDAGEADATESGEAESPARRPSSRTMLAPTQSVFGFSTSGGLASNDRYVLISDPAGTFSSGADLSGSVYAGAIGLLPEEIVLP